jgi:hypothetical protein
VHLLLEEGYGLTLLSSNVIASANMAIIIVIAIEEEGELFGRS